MNEINYCKTCAIADPTQSVCQLHHMKVNLDKDFCSKHTAAGLLNTCAICGQAFVGSGLLEHKSEDTWVRYCHSCQSKFGTCAMCQNYDNCKFMEQSYRPDLPPFVMTTQRQGNMVVQQQVPNPERVKAICQTECKCWYEEGCARNIAQTCENYNFIGDKK